MNERVAQVGNQIKGAFVKVGDSWNAQEPARKKLIMMIGAGLITVVVGLVVVLNIMSGRYVVLYESMGQDESVRAKGVLEAAGVPSRLNSSGQLEVPSKSINTAMGQLAMQGIPSTTLDYNILAEASGLTTTEFEKQEARKNQWQNRLQDTIKSMEGVQNAIVTLNMPNASTRAWDRESNTSSGSVTVFMKPGYVLTAEQAFGIRYLVGSSVGISPNDVTVMDGNFNLLAAAGQDYDAQAAATKVFLERMGLAEEVERRLEDKAKDVMSLMYSDPSRVRVNSTVDLDFDAMVTEIKEYFPLEGTMHGVVDQEEITAVMTPQDFAGGVVGETDNTDVPIYVTQNGDGTPDIVDFNRFFDYAVSYSLKQIEKDGPHMTSASISVVINDSLGVDTQQSLRTAIAMATNLPVENVAVTSILVPEEDETQVTDDTNTILGIPLLYIYIAAAVLLALILVLVLVLVLRAKSKKKRLALEQAELEAEQAEAERIQQEIEERKKQLKNAAAGEQAENAITNEVREFARNNPEITANLLRNWLKEGD